MGRIGTEAQPRRCQHEPSRKRAEFPQVTRREKTERTFAEAMGMQNTTEARQRVTGAPIFLGDKDANPGRPCIAKVAALTYTERQRRALLATPCRVRVESGPSKWLEPDVGKLACPVLRGRRGREAPDLPGLSGEPIEARPPSAAYRLQKLVSRHRAALATAAALVLMLLAGTVTSTWQALRAVTAEQAARAAVESLREELVDRAFDAVISGDFGAGQEAIKNARIAGAPDDLLQTLDGLAFLFSGKNDEAVVRLKKATADNPDSLSALSALWWAYRNSADISSMFRVEKTLKERRLQPKNRYEDLFECLILTVNRPTEKSDVVIKRLDKLLQERKRWGAAYAIRAMAWQEHGLESMKIEDFRRAIDDFDQADRFLGQCPFVLAIGLPILTDGLQLAKYQGYAGDAQEWQKRAEEIAAKLRHWPGHLKGGKELARFYAAIGQADRLRELEDILVGSGVGNRLIAQTTRAFPNGDMSKLQDELRREIERPEARLCLAMVLADPAKKKKEREESLRLFRELQEEDIQIGLKTLALSIPLLLRTPNEAKEAGERLLESNEMSGEWRWFKYVTEYHAGQKQKEDLIRLAGPFSGPTCRVNFVIAMHSLANGDYETAREHLRLTEDTGCVGSFYYHWAKAFRQRMKHDETWPSWIEPKASQTADRGLSGVSSAVTRTLAEHE